MVPVPDNVWKYEHLHQRAGHQGGQVPGGGEDGGVGDRHWAIRAGPGLPTKWGGGGGEAGHQGCQHCQVSDTSGSQTDQ